MPRITPNLWFDGNAVEAAEFYVSVFPNSRITGEIDFNEAGPGEPDTPVTVNFELDGQPFTGINGGPQFTFDEAVSFLIDCKTDEEFEHYWTVLTEGGSEVQCGWLKDRFGLSWQVIPPGFEEAMTQEDPEKAVRVTKAMLSMVKLDVAALHAAAEGD